MAGPSAVGYDFMPSKTPVPYWSPCARTCTFASFHGTSLPLNQIVSVGVNPISVSQRLYIVTPQRVRYVIGRVRISCRETAHRSGPHADDRRDDLRVFLSGRIARESGRSRTRRGSVECRNRLLPLRVERRRVAAHGALQPLASRARHLARRDDRSTAR